MPPARRYSGAWGRKAATATLAVPLKQAIDPDHLQASPSDPDLAVGQSQLWVQSDVAPGLPTDLMAEPFGTPVGGGGPVDHDVDDHDRGGAGDAPITQAQNREQLGPLHATDLGTVDARRWQPLTHRDGTPQATWVPDVPLDGDSPATLDLQRTGVGAPSDGGLSRLARRLQRTWERFIDMHRYPVEYRPMYAKHAYTAPEQPATPNGTQLDSPWSTPGPYYATPDSFVAPQVRRTPVPWDQPETGDGTAEQLAGVTGGYGLRAWGL